VEREQPGLDGSAHPERGAHLLQHLLLPGAHLLGTEPQEATLGPPGSASEIATPATRGARRIRVHSWSVKSCLDVRAASCERASAVEPAKLFASLFYSWSTSHPAGFASFTRSARPPMDSSPMPKG
jgi:hypothetical protein